jgi:hypothetical protein
MKSRILLFLIYLLPAIPSLAQSTLTWSPVVFVNVPMITEVPNDYLSKDEAAGMEFGADLIIGKRLYAYTGVRYFFHTIEFLRNEPGDVVKIYKSYMNGLHVPIRGAYELINKKWLKNSIGVTLNTGPSVRFLLGTNGDGEFDKKETYNHPLFGWGTGISADLSFATLMIDYEFGISEVYKDNPANARMNMIQVGLAIKHHPKYRSTPTTR